LTHLIDHDGNRGRLYDVVCCLTSEESFAEQAVVADSGIPVVAHPIRRFCGTRGCRLSDTAARAAYDRETTDRLSAYRVDLVVLTSYLYVLSEPMLASFRDRIVNIHHSDLTLRHLDGRPRLPGLRAVRDALLAGLHETRATAHLVTGELDQGPPFLRSWPFPVSPLVSDARTRHAVDVLKAYTYAHQEWMIRATWGPLAAAAIELIARHDLDLSTLARTPHDDLGPPWELAEDGRICGRGPLAVGAADLGLAWVS
jgi:folate-dependent phosphoribosylglycinamide formyltransferase PurN